MFTSLDFFYIIASICLVAITVFLGLLAYQLMQVLRNLERLSQDLEHISTLAEKVAQVVSPGILQVAHRTNQLQEKVAQFIEKKVEQLTK